MTKSILGSTVTDTVSMTTEGHDRRFLEDAIRRGTPILAWALHDGGRERLWGSLAPVVDDTLRLHGGYYPMARLRACLRAKHDRHAMSAYDGIQAIASLRVRSISRLSGDDFEYECEDLGWLLGRGPVVPRRIVARLRPTCMSRRLQVGDTLALPLRAAAAPAHRRRVEPCIESFRLTYGYIPALGVAAISASRVLEQRGSELRLKGFVREGGR